MTSEKINEIPARYSLFQSLSVSDLEDSPEQNICHTQAMQAKIAKEMSKLQEKAAQKAHQTNQVASLQDRDQQLAEIMEEEMTH